MADGAWLDPNINAWWLDRSSPNDPAASAAFGRGMQMAQQRLESMQQSRREETATKFKMLDFMLESQRNQIALQTFKVKQDTDILRSQGMAEIGDYLSGAVKNGKLNDPSTQAGFFSLTSKYAPFINEQTVNSMWDNTFGNAMRREDAAKRIREGSEAPAVIQYQERLNKMESELAEMSNPSSPSYNPDAVDAKQKEIQRFRVATRLITPEESTTMAVTEFRAQKTAERAAERMEFEREQLGTRTKSQKELQEDRAKRKSLQDKLKVDIKTITDKYALQLLQASVKDPEKRDKLIADRDKELDDLMEKYNATFESGGERTGGIPTPSATGNDRVFDFDPNTYKVVK